MGKWCSLGLINGFFIYKLAFVSYKTTVFLPNSSLSPLFLSFFFFNLSITVESRIVFIVQCLVKCSFILVILDDWVAWTANNYFSVWKQGSSRSRAGQVQFLVSALFLVCWRLLSHCPHLVERTLYHLPRLRKDWSHHEGSTLTTSSRPNYLQAPSPWV